MIRCRRGGRLRSETSSDCGADCVNALEWLRDSDEQPSRPVYVIHGDDPYLIRESMGAVARRLFPGEENDAAVTRFLGASTPLSSVLDELRTLPFFSSRRLVVVDDADPFVTKYRRELEAYVEKPCQSATLLLQVKQFAATTILYALVDQHGLLISCSAPRDSELASWLIQLARTRFNARLDQESARLLVELVGPEAGILAAEVEKLAVYAGDSRRIERDDIVKLVGAGRVETIWKTLDAATFGDGRAALEYLDTLLSSGEHPTPVLAAMSANLLKIHQAGRLRAARVEHEEACRIAGIPSFAFEKTRRQHAHLGPRRVDLLPEMLLRADLDLKGGSLLEPRAVLEMLLIRLAVRRTD
jgi:DNA polymerase-3 subunit delta